MCVHICVRVCGVCCSVRGAGRPIQRRCNAIHSLHGSGSDLPAACRGGANPARNGGAARTAAPCMINVEAVRCVPHLFESALDAAHPADPNPQLPSPATAAPIAASPRCLCIFTVITNCNSRPPCRTLPAQPTLHVHHPAQHPALPASSDSQTRSTHRSSAARGMVDA